MSTLVSPSRYPGVPAEIVTAIQNEVVLELFETVDAEALKLKHAGYLQRFMDLRSVASAIFAEVVK